MNNSKSAFFKKVLPALTLAVPVIGAVAYFSLIFNNNLWLDEAFSAALIRGNMKEVLEASAADTLPPLYNVLNKIMTLIFGYHPWAMKLTSVIPMILLLVLSATVIRRRFGDLTSLLFSLCICGMPCFYFYGLEIRMYSLGMFFATACGIYGIELYHNAGEEVSTLRKWANRILFLVCALGAGYTHHFAFVAVGFVFLFLLIVLAAKRRLTEWLLYLAVTVIGYFPCLLTTLQQMKRVGGYFTMPDITPHFVMQCIKMAFTTEFTPLSLLLLTLFSLVILWGILQVVLILIREKKADTELTEGLLCFLVYPGVLIFGCLVTVVLHTNIFTDRYLVPSLALFWLGFSILASRLVRSNFVKNSTPQILLALILVLLIATDAKTYANQFAAEYQPGVLHMMSDFDEMLRDGDAYLIRESDYQIEICFRYYFPEFQKVNWEEADSVNGQLYYLEVPGFSEYMDEISQNGYLAEKVDDYRFDRYEFTMYRLYRK